MKIAMVSKALVVGAYQRKLEELARQPGVDELTVIVPPSWREGGRRTELERAHLTGYRLIVAPIAFNGQHHLHFYPTLGRLLAELRPDVLHVDEEPYNLVTWLALRAGAQIGARGLFFTWQNLYRRYPLPFRYFERHNYRVARYALAGNQAAAEVLRRKGYAGPLAVIPQFGIDPHIFSPEAPRPADRAAGFVIGYAGRLVPEKGVDSLLRACAGLPFHDWTLHLLGDGPARAEYALLAQRLGIAHRVRFLGHLPSTQVVGFYRTLDALVLPSVSRPNWIEQFGRVLIEAMACGVPVIGSDSGEIPHVIGEAGLVFPEGDAAALTERLVRLAGAPDLSTRLADAGRARVRTHFTHAHIAAETARIYRLLSIGEHATGMRPAASG